MPKYIGIDASSKSIAWGLIEDQNLLAYGEVFFTNPNFDMRLVEAKHKTRAMMDIWNRADYLVFERVIMGPNKEVALKLAQIFGVMKAELLEAKPRLVEAPPMSWQQSIGNPVYRGKERTEFFKLHPEWKTRSQKNSGMREHRKSVTQDIVYKTFGENITSDNITDGIGLAMFGQKTVGK